MQPEHAHEKGLFEGLQGMTILSVDSALHTPPQGGTGAEGFRASPVA